MKREFIVYSGLLVVILALFSFEHSVIPDHNNLDYSSFRTRNINSISIDIPANVFFTTGSEPQVIVEGSSTLLNLIELTNYSGHLALQSGTGNNIFQHVMAYLWSKQPVNVYVISDNIERIKVADNHGTPMKNALFNGDRAVMKVENDGLIQMIKASQERKKCKEVAICASNDIAIAAECL